MKGDQIMFSMRRSVIGGYGFQENTYYGNVPTLLTDFVEIYFSCFIKLFLSKSFFYFQ